MKVTKRMLHPDLQPFYSRLQYFEIMFRSKWLTQISNYLMCQNSKRHKETELQCGEIYFPSSYDGSQIRAKVYKPKEHADPLPLLIYFHGGGYVMGCPELSIDIIKLFIQTRPCVVVAPDYRKAYTEPYPAGFNDCYDTLRWTTSNADELGATSDGVILAGHSAGGGLTAAVSLKARDTGDVKIAFQMPIYPMIDDRQPQDNLRDIDVIVWNSKTNRIGWNAYLADLQNRGAEIPSYAAPARNSNYHDLPPTITLVGTYDPFYEETKTYVNGLTDAGIDVAFEEYTNCFHAFDFIASGSEISKKAVAFTFENYAKFFDRYVGAE